MRLDSDNAPLLMVSEVATRLKVSDARVYELVRSGILPGVRIGRQVRVDPKKLDEFVRSGGAALHPDA